jgi:predicted HicB family RNase H-like nuclease
MGRPKLETGKARSNIVGVRLTPEQRKRLEEKADKKGQSVTEYVRGRLSVG